MNSWVAGGRGLFLIFLLVAIYCGAWWLQEQFFLNGDLSFCLHAARLLLEGGSYTRDFFNPNPPLILYLQIPALKLQPYLHGNLLIAARLYLFLLVSLSCGLCLILTRKLFLPQAFILFCFFNCALAGVLLILPLYHFGEREHLLLLLTLPYLLLVASRLQPELDVSPRLALLIGCLAALGFALKPPFLLTPFLLELYLLWRTRRLFFWARYETLALAVSLTVYFLSLFAFHSDFIHQVLPFVLRNYYRSVSNPWSELFLQPATLFCLAILLFYFAARGSQVHKKLRTVLLLSLCGFLLAYFAQQTTFFYHLLPALSVALLLLLLELGALLSRPRPPRWQPLFWVGSLLLAASLPLSLQNYWKGREYKKEVLATLVDFLQTQKPHASLYVFARWGTYAFPVVDYSSSHLAQRFDCLWPVLGFVKTRALSSVQQNQDRDFFIQMVAEDFQRQKPDLVFVDQKDSRLLAEDSAFDYPDYFSQNPRFRQEWQAYHYLTTLDVYPLYQLVVYQRRV